MNPEWAAIAQLLRASGMQLWLLTSGLSLLKHARRAGQLFDAITVSLDGTNRETYAAIRGLDAFDNVCAGIRAAAGTGVPVGVRVTVQRANYQQLPAFVDLARQAGARQVSFLAVDVASPHAFGRSDRLQRRPRPRAADLPKLEQILCTMESDYADAFRSGFIAESARRLRHIHQYFSAVCGAAEFPPVRCNAPEFSAVIAADRAVSTPASSLPALPMPACARISRKPSTVTRCLDCARTFATARVPNAKGACAHYGASPALTSPISCCSRKHMLDLTHEDRVQSVAELMRPARRAITGRLIGKAMTLAYKLTGKDRYDDFLLERVLGVPFIVTPSVFNPKVPRTGAFLASLLDATARRPRCGSSRHGYGLRESARSSPPVMRAASWRWTSMPPRFAVPASTRA
jgi:hypothetical protein